MSAPLRLPPRPGPRPRTSDRIPHRQLDQQPEDGRFGDEILTTAGAWPHVTEQPSGISVEGARAVALEPGVAGGPPEAFLVDREFCHVHAEGDHSLHATLPIPLATAARDAGWAEPHFLVRTGRLPATVVMLYAPRTAAECEVVADLVRASYEFALSRTVQTVR